MRHSITHVSCAALERETRWRLYRRTYGPFVPTTEAQRVNPAELRCSLRHSIGTTNLYAHPIECSPHGLRRQMRLANRNSQSNLEQGML